MVKVLLLALLLYTQDPVGLAYEQVFQEQQADKAMAQELEEARRRLYTNPPLVWMITLVAQFQDGAPAKGTIGCSGSWFKFDEAPDEYSGEYRPFKTDSRGAIILNPNAAWFDGSENDIGNMTCIAQSGLRSGKLTFRPHDGGKFIITIPGKE